MYSDILENIYLGETAEKVQSLSKDEKDALDWATRQYLTLDERVALCKETVLQWDIYKFKCKPFTLGLFKDLYQVIAPAFFGKTSESEIFAKCATLILEGQTDGSRAFLHRGLVDDVLSLDGTDLDRYAKGEEMMSAVSFFSLHYWRFGEKLKVKNPQVVETKPRKSPKPRKS